MTRTLNKLLLLFVCKHSFILPLQVKRTSLWNKACEELRKHQELLEKVKMNEEFLKDPYGEPLWYLFLFYCLFMNLQFRVCFSAEDIKAEFDNFAESSEVESAESEAEAKYSQRKSLKSEGKKFAKKKKKLLTRHGPVKPGHGKLKRASKCVMFTFINRTERATSIVMF